MDIAYPISTDSIAADFRKYTPMKLTRTLALTALATATAASLVACSSSSSSTDGSSTAPKASSAARTLDEIKSSGTLKVGVFSDKSPFGSVNAQGEYAGYDIEYGQKLADDLGVKVEWVPVDAAARVEYLESNKVDIILANFTVTEERAQKVDFADPYLLVSLGVASSESKPVSTEDELANSNIIVVKGTTAETYVDKNLPNAKVTKYEQYTEATNALADGRGDAWLTDNTEALAWTNANKGFTTSITKLGSADKIAAAVHKGNTSVLNWINEDTKKLESTNFFLDAYTKTLEPVYGDQVAPSELLPSATQQ